MVRIRRGVQAKKRHKKILKQAKGFRGARRRTFKVANQAVNRAGQYAYRDRRVRKREFRKLWIIRINAAIRLHDLSYSSFISKLNNHNITINRKTLAYMAVNDPEGFNYLVKQVSK